ncbi:MAG: glycosyltransferase [Synergistaceae bacterium]|jgi:glycosyltransferase involved in cell wall biosynthesis|nr:glycosyltransferase [Synergistaceae bacterium]
MRIGFLSMEHLREWTGITRLVDRIATEMSVRGHFPVIIARKGRPVTEKVPVSPMAYPHETLALDLDDAQQAARKRIAASGLDVCVGMFGDAQALYMPWLFSGSGIPCVVGDPADPRFYTFARWQPYEHYAVLAFADAVQALLEDYLPYYPPALRSRITVIGNPIPPFPKTGFYAVARANKTERAVLSVGRLNEADKRLSLLLRAFATLAEDFPNWRLRIVGDGPHWEFYRVMAKQLGIAARTDFIGATADPDAHYAESDIFCLPSLVEGFPMVYAEAASHALPLVGFASCAASSALIVSGAGVLAGAPDSPKTLEAALRPLMSMSPEERTAMGLRARETLQAKYGGALVYDAWEKLLTETAARRNTDGTEDGKTMEEAHIGPEWDGLGPESGVWSRALLNGAAAEVAARERPLTRPEKSSAPEDCENVRLRCELARLRQDYRFLEKKYARLMERFQQAAGRKKGERR